MGLDGGGRLDGAPPPGGGAGVSDFLRLWGTSGERQRLATWREVQRCLLFLVFTVSLVGMTGLEPAIFCHG